MKFDLRKACSNCPFKKDSLNGWLGEARAREIVHSITAQQGTFSCHKTTEYDDETGDNRETDSSQHCAGAMIFLEYLEKPNQLMRISERLGGYDGQHWT